MPSIHSRDPFVMVPGGASIELAIDEAGAGETILPEHLFLAIGRARDALGGYVLSQLGATPERVRTVITSRRTHD